MKRLLMFVIVMSLIVHPFSSVLADDGDVYVAYPVIFVHGLASNEGAWSKTKKELNKYYYDEEKKITKYDYTIKDQSAYFPHCNYKEVNSGDLTEISLDYIAPAIYKARKSFPANYKGEKKVIIVTHSMGGVATMSLLKQLGMYEDIIDKVVFVGTPFYGSPYASMLWTLNNLSKKILPWLILKYKSYSFLSGRWLTLDAYIPAYKQLYTELMMKKSILDQKIIIWLELLSVPRVRITPNPNGRAIEQLRLAGPVSYADTAEGRVGFLKHSILIEAGHPVNTFFSYANLAYPKKYRVIKGVIGKTPFLLWLANKMMKMYESGFSFPEFSGAEQSLKKANITGDGVVTKESQVGKDRKANYAMIGVSHIEETAQYQTILKAIDDDPPEVTGIYAVPKHWVPKNKSESEEYYIVVGCKEYLLADVEVITLTVDGKSLLGQVGKDNKPYNKFGKEFLQERDSDRIKHEDGTPLKLKPGEFYVSAKIPQGKHSIVVELKNPAGKKSIKGKGIFSRPKVIADFISQGKDAGPMSWIIDVKEYDEWERKEMKDMIGNKGNLLFTIKSPFFKDVDVAVDVYGRTPPSTVVKETPFISSMLKKRTVSLKGSGTYTGNFPDNSQIKITETDESKLPLYYMIKGRTYPVRVYVRSHDTSGIQPPFNTGSKGGWQGLLGSNWDNYEADQKDAILADPTFVQYKREYDIPLGLFFELELLGAEIVQETNQVLLDKDKYETFIRHEFIPLLNELVCIERSYYNRRQKLMDMAGKGDNGLSMLGRLSRHAELVHRKAINNIKNKMTFFFHDINDRIPGVFFNNAEFYLNYRESVSSRPVEINILEENRR